jgi:hypothetical protein
MKDYGMNRPYCSRREPVCKLACQVERKVFVKRFPPMRPCILHWQHQEWRLPSRCFGGIRRPPSRRAVLKKTDELLRSLK